MCVVWFNSAGPMARVWDMGFTVPLAVAWLQCALWAGRSLFRAEQLRWRGFGLAQHQVAAVG